MLFYGCTVTRNAGERILEFAEAMGYVVTGTLFKKRQSHLVTYESGGNKTAVDIILIKREHKKRIVNTKVIPGEECVHGHHLVVMDMHLKVRKYRKNHQGLHKVQHKIKVWKLKKQEVRKAYLEKLQERDIDIEDSVRVEEQWDKVEKAMTEVAATVCGVTKCKCRQRETWWWCDEVEKAVETKKEKLKEWKKAEECEKDVKQAEYKASRNEAKRCIARIQAEVLKKQADTLDKVEKAMTEVAATVCGVTKCKCRQRETWWWCDEVEKAVETKKQKSKEWKKDEVCEKDMNQAEYKASRNEAKRCIARVQAETLDSKEGRQRIGKQKKKERQDITGTNCLKGDNGELLVSEEQVSGR